MAPKVENVVEIVVSRHPVEEYKESSNEKTYIKILNIFAIIIGALSAYSYYPLGRDFGKKEISSLLRVNSNDTKDFLGVFFGLNSLIPTLALSIISTYDLSKKLGLFFFIKDEKKSNKALMFLFSVFSIFSIIPRFFLTIKYLHEDNVNIIWKILIIPSSFIAPFAIGIKYNNELASLLYFSFYPIIKQNNKAKLLDEINKLTSYVAIAPNENIEILNKMLNESFDVKNLSDVIDKKQEFTNANPSSMDITARKIFGYAGFVIGALANYAFWDITNQAVIAFCNLLNIKDEKVQTYLSWFSLLMFLFPSIALRGIATQNRLERFFDFFHKKTTKCTRKDLALNVFFIVEGFFSALPQTELAIISAKDKAWYFSLLVIPSFISPFCVSTFSLSEFFKRLSICNSKELDKSNMKKDLLKKVDKIKGTIKNFPPTIELLNKKEYVRIRD